VRDLYEADLAEDGFVMNLTHLWAHAPATKDALFDLLGDAVAVADLTFRQRGLLVAATASTLRDAYCSVAWGNRLAAAASPRVAAAILSRQEDDEPELNASDRALVRWARAAAQDPSGTTVAKVQALRDAGFDDRQIFGITLFVGLRIAFATVNGALGAVPDRELLDASPEPVRTAITYGRLPSDGGSAPA
jgi:alkylhydroperoxidase family enzyme